MDPDPGGPKTCESGSGTINVSPLCVQLLLGPVFQCFHYFKYLELLTKLTPYKEDRDSLKQVGWQQGAFMDIFWVFFLPYFAVF
jgi:hypothetical protein